MKERSAEVVVAGHICLDVIPAMDEKGEGMTALFVPGKLVNVGPALLSTGGAVSNTGLALHRLGIRTKLMSKIGDDLFGKAILDVLGSYGDELAGGMIVAEGEHSSYSLVISPPGVDRIFLHSTGANDTFVADDIRTNELQGARLFHFGYPPLMRNMYENGGEELARLLSRAKSQGLTISLDMAKPDPESPASRVDWRVILERALPHVDVFLPSFEEILFMLHPERYAELTRIHQTSDLLPYADGELLSMLSTELIQMGVAIVAIKLGEHGLYVRTTSDCERIVAMGVCAPSMDQISCWTDRELLAPCFKVKVAGTTGAGDCTIAGFLAGLLKGLNLEEVLHAAVGVGACNVERSDATSGIPIWEQLRERIAAGWEQGEVMLDLPGWNYKVEIGAWAKK
ncbi:carbohydrate kinase family protein [Paenibacillus anseongense]|uniref:carbohydrate kinase family protein n=1 Tax=Paenibacillus TaxID=44249 RepID=UPI002DBF0BE0|nr:carbohydrate kinase family protein [Paenibacillus anseongense]MEC0267249.1 carbohydrate kinase family protein [Paenibacillus anseongense]